MSLVGILGAGQLGRMLALAGYPLGLGFRFFSEKPDVPSAPLGETLTADYAHEDALRAFARGCDVVTYEFENVPVDAARVIAEEVPVRPAPRALEVAQDRLAEKTFFHDCGVPTAPFETVDSRDDLEAAIRRIGTPAILKTRRWGYDGKGQFRLHDPGDVAAAWDALGGRPLILEGFVAFERELSILSVRGPDGGTAFYPLVQNHHLDGILRLSIAPAPDLDPELQREAEEIAGHVLERLDYVGVLAIELFQRGGHLLANEMAPRVHNSGHWSIEGAPCSQFENHLRAVLGLPLGLTRPRGGAAMANLIGTAPPLDALLDVPGLAVHLYDKAPRPGRKLGHVTVTAESGRELMQRIRTLGPLIPEIGEIAERVRG